MATISQVNADFIAKNPPAEQKDTEIRVYFGVFFDGISNNMIQGETARKFRKDHKKNNNNAGNYIYLFISNICKYFY